MSDNEVAPLETAFGVDHHVSVAPGARAPGARGRPRDGPAAQPRGRAGPARRARRRRRRAVRRGAARLLPRPGPRAPLRRRGHRAAAPGRARPVGQPARPGGRPGRLRPRAAPPGLRLPDLPRARRRLVPRGRPGQPARHVPRGQPRRLGPQREELPPLHDHHRRPDPARHRLRDGRAARRRRRHRRHRRDTAVIAYFGDGATCQGDVTEALVFAGVNNSPVVFFCQNNQWAISEPNEKQTRVPLYQRARGFGFPGHPGRRQRRPRRLRRDQAGPRRRPHRAGPDLRRGLHLPDGRPHDLRRPARSTASRAEVEVWKHRDPIERSSAG